jgi:hypothetical protein
MLAMRAADPDKSEIALSFVLDLNTKKTATVLAAAFDFARSFCFFQLFGAPLALETKSIFATFDHTQTIAGGASDGNPGVHDIPHARTMAAIHKAFFDAKTLLALPVFTFHK